MSVSFTQILIIILVALFLLGKFPSIKKDLSKGIQHVQELISSSKEKEQQEKEKKS